MHIVLTAAAEGDLQAIYNQQLARRGATGADGADAQLDTLVNAIGSLADFPLRGPLLPELAALGMSDWRQLSLWPWRIIYLPGDEVLTVAVIADGRRDFAALLEQRLLRR